MPPRRRRKKRGGRSPSRSASRKKRTASTPAASTRRSRSQETQTSFSSEGTVVRLKRRRARAAAFFCEYLCSCRCVLALAALLYSLFLYEQAVDPQLLRLERGARSLSQYDAVQRAAKALTGVDLTNPDFWRSDPGGDAYEVSFEPWTGGWLQLLRRLRRQLRRLLYRGDGEGGHPFSCSLLYLAAGKW